MLTYYTRKESRVQMIGRDHILLAGARAPRLRHLSLITYDSSLVTMDVAAQMIDKLAEFLPNVRGMRPRIF